MSAEPTKVPWSISKLATPAYAPEYSIHQEDCASDLARVIGGNSEADAELIVRAVNAHDELVRCLDQLLNSAVWAKQMLGDIPERSHFNQCIVEARAILQKATA